MDLCRKIAGRLPGMNAQQISVERLSCLRPDLAAVLFGFTEVAIFQECHTSRQLVCLRSVWC